MRDWILNIEAVYVLFWAGRWLWSICSIQDTGISVRKRVIKIFRDIFSVQPDFNKIPDMCVKMIRRVNDEDGIKVSQYVLFKLNLASAWFIWFLVQGTVMVSF